MHYLEFYDNTKTYMYPNGEIATPERVQNDYPAISRFKHVIETDANGEVFYSYENFSAMKTRFNIDPSLNDNIALAAIQQIMNTPDPEPTTPDDTTRIADALEDLVVLNMPDEEV